MTKKEDIEKWIEQNVQVESTSYEGFWWKQGAKAMANNLTNQPPTKEQLVKALKLLEDYGGYAGYTDEINAEVIIQHWNDEECDDEQW